MNSPSTTDETYIAFGDGSEMPYGCFYGLTLIPDRYVDEACKSLADIKLKYGGNEEASLHCRILFNSQARSKSCWAHLTEQQVLEMCGEFLRDIARYQPKYFLGITPKEYFPKRFRLRGKNGHQDLVHDVDSKYILLRIYQSLAAYLDPVIVDTPPDPKLVPHPKNTPWWRVTARRDSPGWKVKSIFLDREETRIRWFSKSFQWSSVAKDFVVSQPAFGSSFLPVEIAGIKKHPLLEWADLFVYSTARDYKPTGDSLMFRDFQAEVDVLILGNVGEEIVYGEFKE